MKLVSKIQHLGQQALGWTVAASLLWMPICIAASVPTQPQPIIQSQENAQEFSKTIKKEFPISATGTVDLTNKYGKIEIHTWDRNRVKVDVTIVVDARSESDAQDVFDRIRIDFSNDHDFVKAETMIETTKSSWWNWGKSNSEFQINYEVFMPESCNLRLANKYGNTNADAISGKADVSVKYGDFQLEGIGGSLDVSLGYGNGTVVKAGDVHASVSYGKLHLNNVQDVVFDTKYSKLYVDQGASVKAESRYDFFGLTKVDRFQCQSRYGNVEIGDARSIVAVSRYTDYKVDELHDKGDFDLEYGGLKLDKLAKGFSQLNLIGKYSDFKVNVEPGANYSLDGETSYSVIAYPQEMNVTFEKEKGTSHEVQGHVGTKNARSVIKANLNYGGLKVRQ